MLARAVKDFVSDSPEAGKEFAAQVELAARLVAENKGTLSQRYLIEAYARWAAKAERERAGRSVRIPYRGGDLFVPADGRSPIAGGLQADLNAAANIGLKALLDPDWPGAWWYVPCDPATFLPLPKTTAGSKAVDPNAPLLKTDEEQERSKKAERGGGPRADPQPINLCATFPATRWPGARGAGMANTATRSRPGCSRCCAGKTNCDEEKND